MTTNDPAYDVFQNLKIELNGKIALLTLNRPEALNAVNWATHLELERVFRALESDDRVHVIVLTGAGKAFSAGGDFDLMRSLHDNFPDRVKAFHGAFELVDSLIELKKPIIAAINGAAAGLGMTIALLCDIVYAAESAKMGDPHVKAGIVAGDGGCLIWPMLVGLNRAKEYLMTGDLMDAATAERIGLVNRMFPDDQLMDEAMKMANKLADSPTHAVRWTKMALNQWLRQGQVTSFSVSLAMEMLSFNTNDQVEAVNSFQEKRKPNFTGS